MRPQGETSFKECKKCGKVTPHASALAIFPKGKTLAAQYCNYCRALELKPMQY